MHQPKLHSIALRPSRKQGEVRQKESKTKKKNEGESKTKPEKKEATGAGRWETENLGNP